MKAVKYCLLFIFCCSTRAFSSSHHEHNDKMDETKSNKINSVRNENIKKAYDGAQVLNVNIDIAKELNAKFGSDATEQWGGNDTYTDIFVNKDEVSKITSYLREKNIKFKTVIENVQDAIDSVKLAGTNGNDEFEEANGHNMTWRSYHRLADIYGYLDYLAETYPDIVTVGSVGNSVEGRQIKFIKISSGKPNAKKFWLDGGTHAREWISQTTATYIIRELVENRDAHMPVIDKIDFYIVPVLNPDGYEYTHNKDRLWRKNLSKEADNVCFGTDLYLNWDYMWDSNGTSDDHCSNSYRGTGPFSEPETRSVSNFILNNIDNMKAFITLHSYGQYIYIPYGYKAGAVPSDFNELETVAERAVQAIKSTTGTSYTAMQSGSALYLASGTSEDWAKGSAGIKYVYIIELRDQGTYGFLLPAKYIIPTASEAFAAIKSIAEAVNELN